MIARENVQDVYPLSPMQEGLLFHALLDPASPAYVEQFSYRVAGALDVTAFEAAWNELVRRHDVLRTAFTAERTKRPLQIVLRERRVDFASDDLRGETGAGQAERIARVRADERRRGFDLARDVLVRIRVLRLGEQSWEVVWTLHHILLDGWSVGVLHDELLRIYRDRGAALPAPVPFARYIEWLEKRDAAASLAYWETYLAGYDQLASVPAPARSERQAPYVLRVHALALPPATTAGLRAVAPALGVTPSVLFQAAWGIVLARYNGTDDVVFGSIVSGRPAELPEIERAIGLYINVVPVRVRPRPGLRVSDLVQTLMADAVDATPHHHCALSDVARRTGARDALLDHVIAFENYPLGAGTAATDGLTIERVERVEQTNYGFVLVVGPVEPFQVEIHYNASVFDDAHVARVAGHLARALEAIVADPARPVDTIDLLSVDERRQLVDGFNGTPYDDLGATTIAAAFARQAAATPRATAVIDGDAALDYAELNARANRLAHRLRAAGAGPERMVVTALDRSADLVVSLLAILKAGAAYVPLDLDYPPARLAFMLADARPVAVLTTTRAAARRPAGARTICLDDPDEAARLAAMPATDPPHARVRPGHPAYVIYTSGSTGTPKGVVVDHRAIVSLCLGRECRAMTTGGPFLALASLAFDASVFEMLTPLLHGAAVTLLPPGLPTPDAIAAVIRRDAVDVLFLTPALFHAVVEHAPDILAGVRHVMAGGDVVPGATVRAQLAAKSAGDVVNGYGPTECTVFTTFHRMPRGADVPDLVPIGRPIANRRTYVLDARLRPVPIGVAGELYIGGPGVARGYLDRPGLTADRFVADPFAPDPGARMYRSGDLARWRANGVVEHLGRTDYQVKVRGFRIELGEIEAALVTHPGIGQAAVLARDVGHGDAPGDRRLVAYVVASAGAAPPAPAELRAYLLDRLPDYMAPAVFVTLPDLPLSPNGKVDRAALPAPPAERARRTGGAPRTAVEQTIAAMWSDVLGIADVGVDDDFFELGGHSLTATRVMSRIRKAFDRDIPLATLFEAPTLAELAAKIETWVVTTEPAAAPAIARQPRRGRERSC